MKQKEKMASFNYFPLCKSRLFMSCTVLHLLIQSFRLWRVLLDDISPNTRHCLFLFMRVRDLTKYLPCARHCLLMKHAQAQVPAASHGFLHLSSTGTPGTAGPKWNSSASNPTLHSILPSELEPWSSSRAERLKWCSADDRWSTVTVVTG